MRKLLQTLLNIGISAAIITYLVVEAQSKDAFGALRDQPKHWGLLGMAWLFCGSAVLLTMVRWYLLVRALDLPLRLKSALRIGFLGYLFNLAPLGIIGGDLLKVVMLSRQFHRKRAAESFASVIVDRVIGLYVLFIVASVAILLTGFWRLPRPEIRVICLIVWVLTAVGTVGILILASPALTGGRLTRVLGGLPYVGRPINSLFEALRLYRSKPGVLATAVLMSAAVHSLFTIGVYFIALGLYKNSLVLPLEDHFVMLPVSGATGVIPLCVGPMEAVLGLLYGLLYDVGVVVLPPGVEVSGLVVALGYRIITVLIAAVGVCYYLAARREVADALHAADRGEADE